MRAFLIITACLLIMGCGEWDKECRHGVIDEIIIKPPNKCLLMVGDAHYLVKMKHIEKDITIGDEVTICQRVAGSKEYYTVHLIKNASDEEEGYGR